MSGWMFTSGFCACAAWVDFWQGDYVLASASTVAALLSCRLHFRHKSEAD